MKVFFFWITNKRVLLPVLGLVVLFSLFPPATADAFWPLLIGGALVASLFFDVPVVSDIVGAAAAPLLEALLAFFNVILGVIAGILQGFYIGMGEVLHRIITYFMSVAVSPSSEEIVPFVKDAFGFSQMFVNSLFILVLVFIGLATILRMQSYQLQRTLPLLLIVALLVNFSGVLVGFVVDMGNIIANYFLDASVNTAWQTNPWQASSPDAEKVGQNIARILYYVFGVFIYFIVLLLFGVRVVILWMLSILAPFAFAALVLPATRTYWTRWWGQLVQWSIIGIPISFFLYLSGRAISAQLPAGEGISQAVLAVFAPVSALLLLFVGVMLSMQLAPAGANKVIDFGKKWGLRGAKAAGSGAWRKLEGKDIKEGGGRISRFGAALSERAKALETAPRGAGLFRKTLARGAKYSGTGAITRLAGRGIELASKETTMRMADKDVREQEAAAREAGSKDSFSVFNMVNEELTKGPLANWNRITGLLNGIRNRNDGDDIEDAFKNNILSKDLLGSAIKTGLRAGPPGFRPLMKSFFSQIMLHPEQYGFKAISTRDETTGEISFAGEDADFLTQQLKSIPTKYNAQDFQGDTIAPENFNMDTEEGKFFMETIARTRGADFMGQILRRPRKEEGMAALEFLFKKGTRTEDGLGNEWLAQNAPDILRWGTSTAARSTGVGIDLTTGQVEELIRQAEGGKTKGDLLEEKAQLEQERTELAAIPNNARTKGERTRIATLGRRMQQIDNSVAMMERPLEELQQEVEGLQRQITEATSEIEADEANLDAYRRKAAAESQLKPLEQELGRRGPGQPMEEQIARDLTQRQQRLGQELNQLNARMQELQNIAEQAPPGAAALGAPYDQAEQELRDLQPRIQDLQEQLQRTSAGLREIEGVKMPAPPVPLPKVNPDMPAQLRGAIERGNKISQTIKETTQEMQKSLQGIRDTEQDYTGILQEMEKVQNQVGEINQQAQAGTITPELQAQRDELQSKFQELAQSRRDLGEEIQQQRETAIRTREAIGERETELEDVRKQMAPLQEEYEGIKEREGREKRIKQRRKRRKS